MPNNNRRFLWFTAALLFSSNGAFAAPEVNAPIAAHTSAIGAPVNRAEDSKDNGWDLLMRAYEIRPEKLRGFDFFENMFDFSAGYTPESILVMRAYTDANAESLRLINEALKLSLARPARAPQFMDGILLDEQRRKLHELGRMMIQRARVQAADEDWRGAFETNLDIVELGVKTQLGGMPSDVIKGGTIEWSARTELRRILPRFDAALAREATTRLLALDRAHPSYADILRMEKRRRLERGINWFDIGLTKEERARRGTPETKAMEAEYSAIMDAAIERAHQPYNSTLPPIALPDNVLILGLVSDFLSGPPFPKPQFLGYEKFERNRNGNQMLAVAFALQSYSAEHKKYPDQLDTLVPQYLEAVPVDVFSPTRQPLQYRLTDTDYCLYSVGLDGIDDKGKLSLTAIKPDRPFSMNLQATEHFLLDESKGDIVFGSNG